MCPSLKVYPATSDDIPSLVSILFEAFANDRLLIGTCYPDTPANRAFWVRSVQSQMTHEGSLVLKVAAQEYGGQEKIIGWAKWLVQRPADSKGEGSKEVESAEERQGALDPDDVPSVDMNMDACRKLANGQYSMLREVIEGRGCYWLNAIAVHPSHQLQGAATMLVSAGTKLADQEGLECFSACTTQANENMKGVLGRAGFNVVAERPLVNGLSVFAGHREVKREV